MEGLFGGMKCQFWRIGEEFFGYHSGRTKISWDYSGKHKVVQGREKELA